ncbi:MAG: hypothetical protein P8Y58_09395 [Novosphingobium sp.]
MKSRLPEQTGSDFEAETAQFREILAKGRSANQLALFDLLVERSNDERSPKEIEIAIALFGNVEALEAGSNSGVRVYVHRLRKRIDEYYRGKIGPRLAIPKGEYRIVFEDVDRPAAPPTRLSRIYRLLTINPALSAGLLLFACAALAFAGWNFRLAPQQRAIGLVGAERVLLGASAKPFNPLIVVGDSMLLAETRDQHSIQRMILKPAIRTRNDFGAYLKSHPEAFYRLYDFNLHFAPIASIQAAWTVQSEIARSHEQGRDSPAIIPASAISQDQIGFHDIIFAGRLSQLGVLQADVFAQSRFKLIAYNRLLDTAKNTLLKGQVYTERKSAAQIDYGYLAVRNSSEGHRLIVVAGLGDIGTASMAALFSEPKDIALARRQAGGARHFEALFAVQSRNGAPASRRLVAAHALP